MSAAAVDAPAAIPMPIVWRFAASGLVSAFAMLLVYPAAVVALSGRGHSAAEVGLFAALTPLAMLALILALPALRRRFGHVALARGAIGAGAAAIAILLASSSYPLWCLAAVLVGVQFAIQWTSIDTVLSENVPKARAGAIIGFYQTLLAGAVATGPAIVAVLAVPFATAAWIALAMTALSALPTLGEVARRIDSRVAPAAARGGLLGFWRRDPALVAASVVAGLFEAGTSAMGSVHALHLGYTAGAAVMVASVVAGGSLLAQFPIGALADRFSAPTLMRASGIALFASAALLPLAVLAPALLWPLVAIWGAFGGGLQTLVYMHVAKTKRDAEIGLGMITMALGFTFGSLVGPALGGLAADAAPNLGLAAMLAGLSAAMLATVWRTRAE